MNAALVLAAIEVVKEIVKEAPQLKQAMAQVFSKDEPTEADWEALRKRVEERNYESMVPHSRIPREGQRRD